eukprot:CAMPEP_0202713272 /NCGR_PEP_ID=MMETSP1385-20130828/52468_1 /ASSEMBLY_ACC=CAM_ASM_000861 /TAXON_ID=933848 /ORGANISM="Elphidium margaritaceum" /LENGTH=457 /DNA_ID=CAMNT_0049373567 /DNA_START=40 /DNA_END=1413 /DNA_ORIENTATION=-
MSRFEGERDNLEVEEKQSDGARLHSKKALLVGYMRSIANAVAADPRNVNMPIAFRDICQACYLFFWGSYPLLYLLNGSGEDGDEYHCNGVLVINITDGRFNYLNIYDASFRSETPVTLREDWDRTGCGVSSTHNMVLPSPLVSRQVALGPQLTYHCIFRCGGKTIETLSMSYDFSVICFKNDSNSLTKMNEVIFGLLSPFIDDDQVVVIDALDAYEVALPSFTLPSVPVSTSVEHGLLEAEPVDTSCHCAWSMWHGMIAAFGKNIFLLFDWYGSFEWKSMCSRTSVPLSAKGTAPAVCMMSDNDTVNELFVINQEGEAAVFNFVGKTWRVLRTQEAEEKDGICVTQTPTSLCFDRQRERMYFTDSESFHCWDIKNNKWIKDIFPVASDDDNAELLFVDEVGYERLFVVCGAAVYALELDDPKEWLLCEDMLFSELAQHSPMHDAYTFERFMCSSPKH